MHSVKAEDEKITFLCSCAVSDQVMCIRRDASSHKAKQEKICSELRFDAPVSFWVSSISWLNSPQKRNKVEVVCGFLMRLEKEKKGKNNL